MRTSSLFKFWFLTSCLKTSLWFRMLVKIHVYTGDMETPQHGNWSKISWNQSNFKFFLCLSAICSNFVEIPQKSDFGNKKRKPLPLFFNRFTKILDPFPLYFNEIFSRDFPIFLRGFPYFWYVSSNFWPVSDFFKTLKL